MIRHTHDPPNTEVPLTELGSGLTQNDRFYVRCNFAVPRIDVAAWRLDLAGAFDRPRSWTLDELQSLTHLERTVTLECAGNGRTLMAPVPSGTPWGLGATSTTRFGGISLADVLERSGLRAPAVQLVFTGADHGRVEPEGEIAYEFNLDVAAATASGPILAWSMGGVPLEPDHGFPVRLVVPGDYGMRSVKWLTRITAVEEPFAGHFPRKYRYRGERGVADETPVGAMRVRSIITSPGDGARLAATDTTLRGIAWSGSGSIQRVETGIDGAWLPARIGEPLDGTGPVPWSFDWSPSAGQHELAVRATDAAGNTQPESSVWNEGGYGNNVVHRITVEVA